MKKGEEYDCIIEKVKFPNKGITYIEDHRVIVKNVIEGQKVHIRINKKRGDELEGYVLKVLEKSPDEIIDTCSVFGRCGGCTYQSVPYEKQLELKSRQIKEMIDSLDVPYEYESIVGSPEVYAYRNKMEFSFGDEYKGGPLALGLHKRGSHHDIVNVVDCKLNHYDFNVISMAIRDYFEKASKAFYNKGVHIGFQRHLVIRQGKAHNQLMINLITSSQDTLNVEAYVQMILSLPLENQVRTILHTINDNMGDMVQADETRILYGNEYFEESILGLKFKISPFSFFQVNTYGAEKLYEVVREYVGDTKDQVVFDLYSGTGIIAQLVSPVAKKAVGVEIIEEAVISAKANAELNGLDNCEFIAGDVLKVLDEIEDKPDMIILDPPRVGIHPKALVKIIDYGVDRIVYVSCKPSSLIKDLQVFLKNGYKLERVKCVDMFPHTPHVECVCLLKHCK
ncbi:MAG: 23S rRNA (uracil(1939)-C(5))-methyltransferase RlmD [Vallitaleaceae bacterium]|jgi:23S rRNA (uracil1939-C5)-methyltransferase|nr:23S rRNA (uracil(1939)-C(5))-methyltransferase RlmD [Vallitaleaceae bacterium]